MSKELKRMQKLAGVPVKKESKSLNEHQIGGIVGIGAINQIVPRDKTDYEMAFEYFMNEGDEKEEKVEEVDEGVYEENDEEGVTDEPERLKEFQGKLDDLVEEYHHSMYMIDDVFKGLEQIKNATNAALGGEVTGTDIGDLDTSSSVPDFGDDEITGTELEEADGPLDMSQEKIDLMKRNMEDALKAGKEGIKSFIKQFKSK